MSKKVLKLDFEKELDFLLFAIVSGQKDYRLCFELNNYLELNFCRMDDVSISAGRPGSRTSHSYFSFKGNDLEAYHILSNRDMSHTGLFIPELKGVDYFFLISGVTKHLEVKSMLDKIRSVKSVLSAHQLNPDDLKSAEAFLSILEN